ncbi:hypothetical protein B6E66_30510 [Streptomyces maremycinicus]|nr:hypothetical protein B6E66_30510 [Streptomyces sp. B9173]
MTQPTGAEIVLPGHPRRMDRHVGPSLLDRLLDRVLDRLLDCLLLSLLISLQISPHLWAT